MESMIQPIKEGSCLSDIISPSNYAILSETYNIPKDLCHINKEQTVLELMTSNTTMIKPLANKECTQIESLLVSKVILSIHDPTVLYRINSISFDKNPNNTEIQQGKKSTTIYNHYAKNHNIAIKFKTQPLLKAKLLTKKKQIKEEFLLPELTYLIDVDINNLFIKLANSNKKKIIEENEEKSSINEDEDDMNDEKYNCNIILNNVLNKCIDINVDEKAKDNNEMDVYFSANNFEIEEYINRKKEIQSMLRTNNWLMFFDNKNERQAKQFKNRLIDIGRVLNINVEEPLMHKINYNQEQSSLSQRICDELDSIANKKEYFLKMIVIILPSKDNYNHIKQHCIERLGLMTQILISSKIRKANQYYQSLLMQLYQKTGNDAFRIQFKKEERDLMVCGITIADNGNANENQISKDINNTTIKTKSDNGVSLSIASSYTNYYTNYHFEHIADSNSLVFKEKLIKIMAKCIEHYCNMNDNKYPHAYVIYIQNTATQKHYNFETIIIEHIANMLYQFFSELKDLEGNKVHYTILEVSPSKQEILKSREFCISKNSDKEYSRYTLVPTYSNLNIKMLHDFTLKLTYYNWIKLSSVPSCLRYSKKGNKMLQTCKINSINEGIKNEAFYL